MLIRAESIVVRERVVNFVRIRCVWERQTVVSETGKIVDDLIGVSVSNESNVLVSYLVIVVYMETA
jgi:hypothetical protein